MEELVKEEKGSDCKGKLFCQPPLSFCPLPPDGPHAVSEELNQCADASNGRGKSTYITAICTSSIQHHDRHLAATHRPAACSCFAPGPGRRTVGSSSRRLSPQSWCDDCSLTAAKSSRARRPLTLVTCARDIQLVFVRPQSRVTPAI
ncbi:hypothetical protein C0Q70_00787 [Pomacea canaliculata]|uniref:Uncharacterized protein n=1 Tax=Pomacea canaliculata TaxID=400727 RepID=A0A2T7PXM2_POMCA|nr:hypothetical protein C0Q70_00787 [Pomacea canaliculata]